MTNPRFQFRAIILLASVGLSPIYCFGQDNQCPSNWQWEWDYMPAGYILPITLNPPYQVSNQITVTAVSSWQPGEQSYEDLKQCIVTNRGIRSVPAHPVEWWCTRYGDEPLDHLSGSGLTASFTATQGCNVELLFFSSNYDDSIPWQGAKIDVAPQQAYLTIYQLVHQTSASCPGNPLTRTTLGVGETVSLQILPASEDATWTLAGVGVLGSQEGNPNQFSALQWPGSATITATTSDGLQLGVGFSVAAPSGLLFVNHTGTPPTGNCPTPPGNSFGLTYNADVYAPPDNVNFGNIYLYEGTSFPTWEGFYAPLYWHQHLANGPTAMASCPVPGLGTPMSVTDGIGCPCGPSPFIPDWCTVTWANPYSYTCDGSVEMFITYISQVGELSGGATLWTVTKAGSGAYISTSDCVPHWQN